MPRKIVEVKDITVPEARSMMEKASDELGEFQRRTLDYLTKFAKPPPNKARKAVESLMEKLDLDRKEAIQIINCMPTSIEEVRSILAVKGKVILTEELQKILKEVDRFRSK